MDKISVVCLVRLAFHKDWIKIGLKPKSLKTILGLNYFRKKKGRDFKNFEFEFEF